MNDKFNLNKSDEFNHNDKHNHDFYVKSIYFGCLSVRDQVLDWSLN